MSKGVAYAGALHGVVARDLRIFVSYRARAFTQLFGLILTMTIFYYVSRLVAVDQFKTGDDYFAFVVAGLLIMLVLQSAAAAPAALRQELVAGTFERSLVSPMGPLVGIVGLMLFPIAFACLMAGGGFLVSAALFDLPVEWSTAPLAIPASLLSAAAFAVLAIFVLAVVVVFKQSPGVTWLVTLMALTGGVYFPVTLLPDWIEWISEVQPFTPAVDLLRHLLLGTTSGDSPLTAALKLAGFVVVFAPLSIAALRTAIQVGRRRGTILEF
jgi:ABC-2 type transport system permease protein